MSENEESTMSEESDAETSRSHQKKDIFRKYTDKDYGIHDDSDTDCNSHQFFFAAPEFGKITSPF